MATIIYPSPVDFQWMYQRPQQMLYNMSLLGYKCVFINPELFIKQDIHIKNINDNFYVITRKEKEFLKKFPRPLIVVESYPPEHDTNKQLKRDITIFDCLDYPGEQFQYWRKNYDKICKDSDIIICSAIKLYEFLKKYEYKCHLVKNACDFNYFKKAEKIYQNVTKNIGFIGSIAPWLDYEIIEYIACRHRDKNFIYIGDFYEIKDPIKKGNIIYLGRKEYTSLVKYMKNMNVFIIPFKITTMTNCVSPIKLFEYLSTGKPIVSTAIYEVKKLDRSYVYVANNREQFSNYIDLALNEKNKKVQRQAYAYFNSWKFRARKLDNIIRKYLSKN